MKVHCPACNEVFEREVNSADDVIDCPACGGRFNLSSKETLVVGDKGDAPGPGQRLGGYLIGREIGRGGMGIVYEGVQESLGRKVAIKVMYPKHAQDPQFVARFNREAKSLANLNHPNIVSILDRGTEKGVYFFVMEYVDGISLRQLMDEGEIKPRQALSIVPKVCDALEYAHSQGVIHRDIKPGNILLDKGGQVKIADFGLSRIVQGEAEDTRITRSNLVMGTVDYMAPEQRLDSKSVDHRADIYSLGVVLYELLTGELPIGRFDPPSRKNIEVDIRLDEVVLKVLDKNPELRYQRASEMSSDITNIAAGGAAAHTRGGEEKTLLEKVEDRWENWVLAGTIVLFFVNPATNWVLFIAWGILYKHIRDKRKKAARAIAVQGPAPIQEPPAPKVNPNANVGTDGAAAPPPPAPPMPWKEKPGSQGAAPPPPPVPVPPPPRAPAPTPPGDLIAAAVAAKQAKESQPRVSWLAALVFAYSVTILLVFPIAMPFQDKLHDEFVALPTDTMAVTLSVLALGILPGFLGLLMAMISRGRIAAHEHLTGGSLATLAVLCNFAFVGLFGLQWYEAYKEYGYWKDLATRIEAREEGVSEKLKLVARKTNSRKAFQLAADLPPAKALAFFQWGLTGEVHDGGLLAVRGLAKLARSEKSAEALALYKAILRDERHPVGLKEEVVRNARAFAEETSLAILAEAGRSPLAAVRRAAARELGQSRLEGADDVLDALAKDKDGSVAREAARRAVDRVLSLPATEARVQRLGGFLASPHEEVRERALRGLERIVKQGGDFPLVALHFLSKAAESDPSPALRERARNALQRARKTLAKTGKTPPLAPAERGR